MCPNRGKERDVLSGCPAPENSAASCSDRKHMDALGIPREQQCFGKRIKERNLLERMVSREIQLLTSFR